MWILRTKWLLTAIMLALDLVLPMAATAWAQQDQAMRDKMIQAGDYDQFQVPGPGGVRACAETCANDPRCRAWTFVRPVNQCRLKYEVGQIVENPCCVSGVKPGEAADAGGKQGFCSDYARNAVAANDQNMRQGCHLQGSRWSGDFQTHYSWCMGVHREEANTESEARSADLGQCQQTANADAAAKCDHYARISMVQIETAQKAHCSLPSGDLRWGDNLDDRRQACLQAPMRVLEHDIADREAVLATCLAAAGQPQEACHAYVDKAMEQVAAAAANGCDVSGPDWSSARAEHLHWCLNADPGARKGLIEQRGRQIIVCTQQAAKRQGCNQYAEAAVGQALRAANQQCDVRGPNWSRYKDEHVAFCMQASDNELHAASAYRESALEDCQAHATLDPECDDYAKRAVRLAAVNIDKTCGLEGEAWTTEYNDHYKFCIRSNPVERRRRAERLRHELFACSLDHGFKLELGF